MKMSSNRKMVEQKVACLDEFYQIAKFQLCRRKFFLHLLTLTIFATRGVFAHFLEMKVLTQGYRLIQ